MFEPMDWIHISQEDIRRHRLQFATWISFRRFQKIFAIQRHIFPKLTVKLLLSRLKLPWKSLKFFCSDTPDTTSWRWRRKHRSTIDIDRIKFQTDSIKSFRKHTRISSINSDKIKNGDKKNWWKSTEKATKFNSSCWQKCSNISDTWNSHWVAFCLKKNQNKLPFTFFGSRDLILWVSQW